MGSVAFMSFSLNISVCNRWSGRHINTRRFPELDQTQARLSRTASADRLRNFILFWSAKLNTGRHVLLPTDRPLCRLDIDHVLSVLPNDCNHMVLWRTTVIENNQANDRKGTVTVFPIVLARRRTTSVDRNLFTLRVFEWLCQSELMDFCFSFGAEFMDLQFDQLSTANIPQRNVYISWMGSRTRLVFGSCVFSVYTDICYRQYISCGRQYILRGKAHTRFHPGSLYARHFVIPETEKYDATEHIRM